MTRRAAAKKQFRAVWEEIHESETWGLWEDINLERKSTDEIEDELVAWDRWIQSREVSRSSSGSED